MVDYRFVTIVWKLHFLCDTNFTSNNWSRRYEYIISVVYWSHKWGYSNFHIMNQQLVLFSGIFVLNAKFSRLMPEWLTKISLISRNSISVLFCVRLQIQNAFRYIKYTIIPEVFSFKIIRWRKPNVCITLFVFPTYL